MTAEEREATKLAVKQALCGPGGRRWKDIQRMATKLNISETRIIQNIIEQFFVLNIDDFEGLRDALDGTRIG